MNVFPILAQTATLADARMGRSLSGLLCLVTVAGSAIALARWYVDYLRAKGERQRRIIEDFNISHAELQKKFQEQLDRLSDHQQESQRDFQAYVAIMSDIQTMILRDVIVTIKNIEKINGGSAVTSDGFETTISKVQPTDREKDNPRCETAAEEI